MISPRRSLYIKILAIGITVILVAILFTQVSVKDIISTLANSNPVYLLAASVLYICSYFFRAWRFHFLLNKEVGKKDLFNIVCVHNMMNNLLPARTGELSYVYLLKKVNSRSTGEGVATLVLARIFDFIIISSFFVISLFINRNVPAELMNYLWIGIVFIVFMILFIYSLLFLGHGLLDQVKQFFKFMRIDTTSPGVYIIKKGEESINCIAVFKRERNKILGICLLLSIVIWLIIYVMIFVVMHAMNFDLPFTVILLGSTFAIFSTILPIQGIGGFGTTESAWAVGFILMGLSGQDAINSGFGYHIIVFTFSVIIGLTGVLLLNRRKVLKFFSLNRAK